MVICSKSPALPGSTGGIGRSRMARRTVWWLRRVLRRSFASTACVSFFLSTAVSPLLMVRQRAYWPATRRCRADQSRIPVAGSPTAERIELFPRRQAVWGFSQARLIFVDRRDHNTAAIRASSLTAARRRRSEREQAPALHSSPWWGLGYCWTMTSTTTCTFGAAGSPHRGGKVTLAKYHRV